jgi:hypothetical protein
MKMALDPKLMESIRQTKNKYSTGTKTVKLKEGKTCVRFLGTLGQKFWRDLGVHWIKTELNGKPAAVTGCHDITYDQPCPVCAAIERAGKSAVDDDTVKIMKEWKAKPVIIVPALIRSGPDKSPVPQILELTKTTWGKIMSMVETFAESDINSFDLTNGVDFVIERTGKGFDTEYTPMTMPKSLPVDPKIMEQVPDLDAYIKKEFFDKGDEPKALRAIGSMSGIEMAGGPALTAGPKMAALTGPGVHVADAEIEAAVAAIETSPAASAPATTVTAPAAPAATPAVAAPAIAPAAPAEFGAAIADDEIEKMLQELG